jgi:apolipoprotein N-acyltransferase
MAALLLGALSAAALPPFHAIPLLFVAVPGLLALIGASSGWRGAAWTGFWFGLGHHVFGLYWITEAILIESARFWWLVPLAVPALAAVLALFVAVPCAAARVVPAGLPRLLVLAGVWLLSDLARQFVATGFPWNPWGSVWAVPGAFGDVFLQPAAWIGVHGLTLLTVFVAGLPALGARAVAGAAVLLALWAGGGLWRLKTQLPTSGSVALVIVQGNVPQGEKWNRTRALEIFRRYLTLTREGVARAGGGPVVAIWPETASPFPLADDPDARAAVAEAAAPALTLAGSVRWDARGRPRNSLMAIQSPGPPGAIYDKAHLVPFGEYDPGWIPLPIQVVPGAGFGAGPGPQTVLMPGIPAFGPMICYEAAFPGQVVAADRPEWLVNITNDAWFGNSAGPRQHLAAARLRAVEEGLPLARAANTGISAVFDAFGRELRRLDMNQTGTIVISLPPAAAPTLFARFGLAVPGLLGAAASALGYALARRHRHRPS